VRLCWRIRHVDGRSAIPGASSDFARAGFEAVAGRRRKNLDINRLRIMAHGPRRHIGVAFR
jgi:hypothetical protein